MSLKSACEALGISRSGQYRKECQRQGSDKDEVLVEKLKELRLERPFWGYRRMTAWLNHREGLSVNRKRIYRLMRENGLVVEQVRHKALRSSQSGKPKATRPNQYWGIDMTKFILGSSGWCYLMVVLDWHTKEILCSYDNPRGNAETERVIRTIKEELLWLNEFSSFEGAEARIGVWIAQDYNRLYVHLALGYLSPEEFAQQWVQSQEATSQGAQI